MSDQKPKSCFVIGPIGTEGSEVRTRSDQVLKHIIVPAAKQCGYDPLRADQIPKPGIITSQVIQYIVESELVIADLTGHNPNVFYELALRHALRKPAVQIILATESLPFDIAASRTIKFDHKDLDSAEKAREEIAKQIQAVEKDPTDVDSPISDALELLALRRSDNPLEKSVAEIISMLQEIRQGLQSPFPLSSEYASAWVTAPPGLARLIENSKGTGFSDILYGRYGLGGKKQVVELNPDAPVESGESNPKTSP